MKSIIKCPNCHKEIESTYYTEEAYGIVEYYHHCIYCNYYEEFSYGAYRDGFDENHPRD